MQNLPRGVKGREKDYLRPYNIQPDFWKIYRQMDLFRPTVFSAKNYLQSSHYEN